MDDLGTRFQCPKCGYDSCFGGGHEEREDYNPAPGSLGGDEPDDDMNREEADRDG
jgi:hypothetical protein